MNEFFDRDYTAKEAYGRLYHYAVKYRGRLLMGLLAGSLTAGAWLPIFQMVQPALKQMIASTGQTAEIYGAASDVENRVAPVAASSGSVAIEEEAEDHLPKTFLKAEKIGNRFGLKFRDENNNMTGMLLLLGLFVLPPIVLFKMVVMYLNHYFLRWTGANVVRDFRVDLFNHLQNQPLSFFSQADVGQIMSRCTSDPQMVDRVISRTFADICRAPFEIVFSIGYVIYFALTNGMTATLVVVILGFPCFILPMAFLGNRVRKWAKQAMKRISFVSSKLHENLTCIRVVKAYHTEELEKEKYYKVNQHYLKSVMKTIRIELLIGPSVEGVGLLLVAAFVVYCYFHKIPITKIVPLIVPFFIAYGPMKQLSRVQAQIERGRAALTRIFSLLDMDCSLPEPVNPVRKESFDDKIVFDNVTFRYSDKGEPTIKNVSFEIPRGSVVAVVGGTGSGKTTLANLLARFYDVESGAVVMDGVNVKDIGTSDLRSLIGVVTQETVLFNDTIANNIAYGTPSANREQIEAAAKMANAHQFIVSHDGGYDRVCGEKGFTLSGGERQRIAIARAILKNPPILILDEATSALDTVTERLVQDAINKLMSNRTTFAIAHRLSTIKNADKIIVLEKGVIKECGTHAELYDTDGEYRKFCDMQMMD